MSLATRCGTCGTTFRVVQDQLRISEGWVRCGRCDAVFNALDSLVDLDAQAATPLRPGPSVAGSARADLASPAARTVDPPAPDTLGRGAAPDETGRDLPPSVAATEPG